MGPVAVSKLRAPHHLAAVVNAFGEGGKISRQSAEVRDCAVLPKSAIGGCAVSAGDLPNNLAVVVNADAQGALNSEVRKGDGSAVFPQYGVSCYSAGSRVAYSLSSIVDAECDPVWIATHRRKKSADSALVPYDRRCSLVRRASGVSDIRLRISCDLSAVIDGTSLPVISTDRGKTSHVAVLPNKRTTRKVCAEAANVLAVRIWNRCFGKTNRLPGIVDPAIIGPTVLSSEGAEVDLVSFNVYPRPPFYKGPDL